MKLSLSILLAFASTLSLSASADFPLVEPYAVEEAPVVVEPKAAPVVKPEPIIQNVVEEEVVEEKTNNEAIVVAPLDDDNDGVINEQDKCPNTSSDFMVDGYGCPQTMILNINFGYKKVTLSEDDVKDLEKFAKFLKDNRGYQVVIYGHTDSAGSQAYNRKLSQKRADSVKEGLIRYGINETRLTSIGKGEAEPIADNKNKEGRAKNRRIEIELIQ